MADSRTKTWLSVVLLGLGLLPLGLGGLWIYMSSTATPLHPDPSDVSSVTYSPRQPKWDGAIDQGRQAVRAALSEQNLPGLSVAIAVGGNIVWAEGFGWADLEKRLPIAPETRFRIGTASPALTSAAVGLLLERGKLKLDDPVQTYVPEFPEKPWPVTLRHLMGHTAGLISDGGDEGALLAARCQRPVEGLKAFDDRALLFEPGTKYRFSNYGWIPVSAAIESASGKPFSAFMRDEVFEPLGLHDTLPESATEAIPDRATFYFPRFAADPRYGLHLMRDIDFSCYAGASAFLSTPSDLVRFSIAMNSGKFLKPATVKMLQTEQRLASGQGTGYGLGWDLETVSLMGAQTPTIGHDGATLGGPVASLVSFPERGIVVAVISNISYADTPAVALKIAQSFAEPGTPR